MYEYITSGTCSSKIRFNLQDDKVHDVVFEKGCNGNLKAISILVEGMETGELIKRLRGVQCNGRPTSCADQLATAVTKALQQQER
ncbi:MAG: TIGR03905 family TSCPD domain-containing protein [Spirochaetaceae bacterium]|jgi:uncharacterized protein (TIGR03905 family)|nr:TIGR03905 family TSCPD domain-containing protein [Spirochaetaceae bacterium]